MNEVKKKSGISAAALLVSAAVITVIFLSVYFNIRGLLLYFSPDAEVKQHLIDSVRGRLVVFFVLLLLCHLPFFFADYVRAVSRKIADYGFGRFFRDRNYTAVIVIILIFYIIAASLFILLRFDISTDEATYAYTFKHFFTEGKFFYKIAGNTLVIPKDMFVQNLTSVIIKPFFDYTYLIPRFITFFYSLILVFLVSYYFLRKHGSLYSAVFLALYASYPGFIFMSASSFGENIAMLLLLLGLFVLNKFNDAGISKYSFIALILISLAVLTKLQLGFFILCVFAYDFAVGFLKNDRFKVKFIHLASVIVFPAAIFLIFVFIMYDFNEIKQFLPTFYAISSGSLEPAGSIFYKFINITRFFGFQFILLGSIAAVHFIRNRNMRSFLTFSIFGIIVVNALWYILLKGHGFRFMYFALFGITLLSVVPLADFIREKTGIIRNVLLMFLVLYFINGVIQNARLSAGAVSNEYLVYLNGNDPLKTYHEYVRDGSQEKFIAYLNNNLNPVDEVFLIGPESELMAYIPNKFYTINLNSFDVSANSGKFVIKTAVNELLGINKPYDEFLMNHCTLVHREGSYYLFKIK